MPLNQALPRVGEPTGLLNLNWRNIVFASRLAAAAIAALALAYWLELQEPQWAILTVYLLTQSSTGAALAKGSFRFLGTMIAAAYALTAVKLFSQDPLLLVGSAMLWTFACYYGAARASNFAAYGFMLAGFTGLLVIFQGAAAPDAAWLVAVDRVSEISIGIACATLAGALVLPDHAGTQLRALMASTFRALADHCALALRAATRGQALMDERRTILPKLVKFDALRSYTRFEAPEMRADAATMDEVTREFLAVLAAARGLHLRLAALQEGGTALPEPLTAALEPAILALGRIGADPTMPGHTARVRAELALIRRDLAGLARRIEGSDDLPLGTRADAILVCRQAVEMLRDLSLLALAEQAAFRPGRGAGAPRRGGAASGHPTALLQGTRAALALMIFCVFWHATQWDQGIAGITGLALMNYQCVNTDDPAKLGWPYLRAVVAACFCAYFTIAFIYPWLEGFQTLAAFLFLVLLPAGLLIGTPRYARSAGTFTIFYVAAAATGNVFTPDPLTFANFCFGLVFGMFVCLMVARLVPATARAPRRRALRHTLCVLLPQAARGERPASQVAREITHLLGALLPQLSLARAGHDRLLRGLLACASSARELGRLRQVATDPSLPEPARRAIEGGLQRLAALFAAWPSSAPGATPPDAARDALAGMWSALEADDCRPGSRAAGLVVEAATSLRFLEDRLTRDHAFRDLASLDGRLL